MHIEQSQPLFNLSKCRGKYFALREKKPKFCFRGDTLNQVVQRAIKAMEFYNDPVQTK